MTEIQKETKNRVKEYLAKNELTADEETSISQFISAVKGANVLALSKIYYQDLNWAAYKYLHSQFFKDTELYSLLAKATRWSMNPFIYFQNMQFMQQFWQKTNLNTYIGFVQQEEQFFNYMALSHAFKSEIRFIPFFPAQKKLDSPFLSTLYDIEISNGKQIQVQIGILKNMEVKSLNIEQKELIVRNHKKVVEELFYNFLNMLFS